MRRARCRNFLGRHRRRGSCGRGLQGRFHCRGDIRRRLRPYWFFNERFGRGLFHRDGDRLAFLSISQVLAHQYGDVFIDRARVRFFLRDTQFRKQVKDPVGLDLQLARELINANFTHTDDKFMTSLGVLYRIRFAFRNRF
jgi:hypothetical protein